MTRHPRQTRVPTRSSNTVNPAISSSRQVVISNSSRLLTRNSSNPLPIRSNSPAHIRSNLRVSLLPLRLLPAARNRTQ